MSHFYDEITTALPELQVLKDEPMSRHTTFRIGGPADYFVCPDREQIAEVLAVAKNCGMAITVIGNVFTPQSRSFFKSSGIPS